MTIIQTLIDINHKHCHAILINCVLKRINKSDIPMLLTLVIELFSLHSLLITVQATNNKGKF